MQVGKPMRVLPTDRGGIASDDRARPSPTGVERFGVDIYPYVRISMYARKWVDGGPRCATRPPSASNTTTRVAFELAEKAIALDKLHEVSWRLALQAGLRSIGVVQSPRYDDLAFVAAALPFSLTKM